MPCRSRTTGRFLPASRQLADRLDQVDLDVERAFDALRPIGTMLDRTPAALSKSGKRVHGPISTALDHTPAGPLGPDDVERLRTAHEILWSALDKIGSDLDEVRKLVGVNND